MTTSGNIWLLSIDHVNVLDGVEKKKKKNFAATLAKLVSPSSLGIAFLFIVTPNADYCVHAATMPSMHLSCAKDSLLVLTVTVEYYIRTVDRI